MLFKSTQVLLPKVRMPVNFSIDLVEPIPIIWLRRFLGSFDYGLLSSVLLEELALSEMGEPDGDLLLQSA